MNLGQFISVGLFLAILALGFLRPRFWCRYVCPSGAVFSLANLLRLTERKVETSCIHCNKCIEICPFDAIKPDFTTRGSDCTFCQSCGGVCPTHAIKFVERWNHVSLKVENDPPTGDTPIGRRGFLSLAAGSTAAVAAGIAVAQAVKVWGAQSSASPKWYPVRPPGSVPEQAFLQMCIRCGECFKVCPNNVLQAEGFQQGLEGLWTPLVTADWAGCESSCNACGQVCPTGAIRALPLDEKRVARIALAVVNQQTCLPFANREACQLCVERVPCRGIRGDRVRRCPHAESIPPAIRLREPGIWLPWCPLKNVSDAVCAKHVATGSTSSRNNYFRPRPSLLRRGPAKRIELLPVLTSSCVLQSRVAARRSVRIRVKASSFCPMLNRLTSNSPLRPTNPAVRLADRRKR